MGDISTEGCENNSFYNILKTGNFLIPPEQREYVWKPKNILRLFDNLKNNYDENKILKDNEGHKDKYYLGAIHTYCKSEEESEICIIDGQQRFTSLCIILFSLFNYMENYIYSTENKNDIDKKEADLKDVKEPFNAKRTNVGERKYDLRLQSYTHEANDLLKNLFENKLEYDPEKHYEHIHNMIINADEIQKHIKYCFGDDNYNEIHQFIYSIFNDTQMTHIHNPSRRYALRIFLTLNDSGKKLSAIDYLRSEMFGDDRKEVESISRRWRSIFRKLNNDEDKYNDFLTLYLMSIFKEKIDIINSSEYVTKTPQNENSKTLQFFENNNEKLLKDIEEMVCLYKDLKHGYKDNILYDLSLIGLSPSMFLSITPIVMSVKRSCQDEEKYKEFCQSLRNFIVKSKIISRSESKPSIPRMDSLRVNYILDIRKDKNLALKNLINEMNKIDDSFEVVLNEDMRFNNGNLTKYLLARIYHYIEKKALGKSISVEDLVSKDYDIEHCLPQSEAKKNNVNKNIQTRCYSLGNLLLLNKSENRSLKDKPFFEKQKTYMESTFLLNKTMCTEFFKGKENSNNKIMRTIRDYHIYVPNKIERTRINERKTLYIKILKEIFCDNNDVSDEGDVTE